MKIVIKVLAIFILVLLLISRLFKEDYGLTSTLLWISSIIFLINIGHSFCKNPNLNFKIPNKLIIILSIVFLIKVFFILLFPDFIPFHGDEAINSRNALSNFQQGINLNNWNILGSDWGTLNKMSALWYTIQGGIIYLLGPSLLSIKIFALISDLLICWLLYLIINNLLNKKMAFYGAIIYSTLPIAIHFSMTAYQNIQSTLLLYLGVYLLCLIPKKRDPNSFIFYCLLSGIVCGLSLYFYLSSLINPLILLSIIFCIVFFEFQTGKLTKLKFLGAGAGSFFIGIFVSSVPYLYYSFFKYQFIMGRSGEIILPLFKSNFTGTLLKQLKDYTQSFLPSGVMNGSGMHYVNSSLLPGLALFLLFIIGLLISLFKFKKREYFIPLIILLVTSVFGGLLTKDTPAPQRLLHLLPVVIIFIILAINLIKKPKIEILLVAYLMIVNIHSYLSQNIPDYKNILPRDAYETTKLISDNQYNLFFNAPIQKKDQIYFYSQGKMLIQNFDCLTLSSSLESGLSNYFLTDENGIVNLNKCYDFSYSKVSEWRLIFDHTYLLKFK